MKAPMHRQARDLQKASVWFANSENTWIRDKYLIHAGARHFTAWEWGVRKLGEAMTFKAAQELCK